MAGFNHGRMTAVGDLHTLIKNADKALYQAKNKGRNGVVVIRIVGSPSLAHDIQALDLRVGLASLRQQPLDIYLARMDDLIDRQISYM